MESVDVSAEQEISTTNPEEYLEIIEIRPELLDKQIEGSELPVIEEVVEYQWVESNLNNGNNEINKNIIEYEETDNNWSNDNPNQSENTTYYVEHLKQLEGKTLFIESIKETGNEDWSSSVLVQPFVPTGETWSDSPPVIVEPLKSTGDWMSDEPITYIGCSKNNSSKRIISPMFVENSGLSNAQDEPLDQSEDTDTEDTDTEEYVEQICQIKDPQPMRRENIIQVTHIEPIRDDDDDDVVMFFQPMRQHQENIKEEINFEPSVQSIREEMMLPDSHTPIATLFIPASNVIGQSRFHHTPVRGLQDLSRAAHLLSQVKPCSVVLDRKEVPQYFATCHLKRRRSSKRPMPKSKRPMPASKKLLVFRLREKSAPPPCAPPVLVTRKCTRVADTKEIITKKTPDRKTLSRMKSKRALSKRIKTSPESWENIKTKEEHPVDTYTPVIEEVVNMSRLKVEKVSEKREDIKRKKEVAIKKEPITQRKVAAIKKEPITQRKVAAIKKEPNTQRKAAAIRKKPKTPKKQVAVKREPIIQRKALVIKKEPITQRTKIAIKKVTITKKKQVSNKKEGAKRKGQRKEVVKEQITERKKVLLKKQAAKRIKEEPEDLVTSSEEETLPTLKVKLAFFSDSKRGRKNSKKAKAEVKKSTSKTDVKTSRKRARVHPSDCPQDLPVKKERRAKPRSDYSRTYYCKYCPKTYFVASSLYNHMSNLHGKNSEPSLCTTCLRTFKNRDSLSRHDRLYHRGPDAGMRHECTVCDKSYNLKGGLTSHYRDHHPHLKVNY